MVLNLPKKKKKKRGAQIIHTSTTAPAFLDRAAVGALFSVDPLEAPDLGGTELDF